MFNIDIIIHHNSSTNIAITIFNLIICQNLKNPTRRTIFFNFIASRYCIAYRFFTINIFRINDRTFF